MNPARISEAQALLDKWCTASGLAPLYPLYTQYLNSLAQGERLNAVHVYLRPWITELKTASHAERWKVIHALCSLVNFNGRAPGANPVPGIPFELLEQVALPTLLRQREDHPSDSYVYVWLAMLPHRFSVPSLHDPSALLKQALELSPNDAFIAERVADDRLHSIWFACHHLPSSLLGSEATIRREIAALRQLLPVIPPERRAFFEKQATHYAQEIDTFSRAQIE